MKKASQERRVLVHHHALRAGEELCVRYRKRDLDPIHLRQSDLDGACGIHSVYSALVLLGLCSASEVLRPKHRRTGLVALVHDLLGDGWHDGTSPEETVDALEQLPLEVDWATGVNRGVDRFVVERLLAGAVAMVVQQPIIGGVSHWVLAVGCSGVERNGAIKVDTVYCLDPSSAMPPFALANATLRATKPVQDWSRRRTSVKWWNESYGGRSGTVVLEDAVALERADAGSR
jgi:hypothetical protein